MEKIILFYQNLPLVINPIAFKIGFLPIRWYSLCYLAAVATIIWLLKSNNPQKDPAAKLLSDNQNILDFIIFVFGGALIGARLGYFLFFDFFFLLHSPVSFFWPFSANGDFEGIFGMSFHGGLIGALLGGFLFSKKTNLSFLKLSNLVVQYFPLGYFWGRMGNFFNKELFGKTTSLPIGMRFEPHGPLRHPTQIYEALTEGLLIYFILKKVAHHSKIKNRLLFVFLFFYGLIRFFIEFLRETPSYQHFYWFSIDLTLAQFLCFIMVIIGIAGFGFNLTKK